jgi:hypothetical protein
MFLGLPDALLDPLVRDTDLYSSIIYDFLSLKYDVNIVSSKSNKPKNVLKIFFC